MVEHSDTLVQVKFVRMLRGVGVSDDYKTAVTGSELQRWL